MMDIDTRSVVARLKMIESLAVIPRVASTNLVARRILDECIENELSLPQAMIVAGEQFAGRGRNERRWSSPRGKGIYATALITRETSELAVLPLEIANIVMSYLREVYGVDAKVKWPNDVFVSGRKIAGILIEARNHEDKAYVLAGIGVNIEPVEDDTRPNAIALTEANPRNFTGLEDATIAFIEHFDQGLATKFDREQVLDTWKKNTIHKPGDAITCVLPDRTVSGTWGGIDEHGRALLKSGSETIAVAAGDIIVG